MNIIKNSNISLSKKTSIQIYFILFILLNIFDFLNLLSNDFDFFKKLLSWGLIIYLFYKISFTKILTGTKEKLYDILFLIFFSLIAIPKSLLFHLFNLGTIDQIENTHILFKYLLLPLKETINDFTILILFFVGIIGTIIVSISLILNKNIKKPSLLESLNIKDNYFKTSRLILITIAISLFFGIIIFNFFMEWFALAVDSLILVIGLIYYIFTYIKEHTKTKFSSTLKDISNSGNSFFQKLLENLSNKKTFFITIAIFMTLHLLVDAGVYMVPYSIGTQNPLYFQQLDTLGTQHTPIINFFNPLDSQLYNDFMQISTFEENEEINLWYLKLKALLIHISFLGLFFILLVSPFFLYYKTINREKIKIPKILNVFFLTLIFFTIALTLLSFTPYEQKVINQPISFQQIQSESLTGVDIYTNSIYNNINEITGELMILTPLIILLILIIILFKYEKYKIFWEKISLTAILLFTIYYFLIFGTSVVGKELGTFSQDIQENQFINNNQYSLMLGDLEYDYSKETYFQTTTPNLIIESQLIHYNQKNFLHTKINIPNENLKLNINTKDKIFQFRDINEVIKEHNQINYFEELKVIGLRYNLNEKAYINYNQNINQDISKVHYSKLSVSTKENSRILLEKIAEYLRLFLTIVFLIAGTYSFSSVYIRKIILNKER